MKKLLSLSLVVALTSLSAHAGEYDLPGRSRPMAADKGVVSYDSRHGANLRVGVSCSMRLYNEYIHRGLCNIGRQPGSRLTSINTGTNKYKIVRDEDSKFSGEFYRNDDWFDSVVAEGNCWTGSKITFCSQ